MDKTELPADDLEFQRDCYLRLLEHEDDAQACRGYLRRINKLDRQIAERNQNNTETVVESLVEVPIVLTEQLIAPPVRCVEFELSTEPEPEDGVEIEILEIDPDDSLAEMQTTRWKPEDGDFFETMDTALFQRPNRTARYPAVQQRFQPIVR